MSVHQAQLEISSLEFTEWMAYYKVEPFGEMIADLRHGVATSVLANVNRNLEAKPEPYRADDFIHWRTTDEPPQQELIALDDPDEQAELILSRVFRIRPKQ